MNLAPFSRLLQSIARTGAWTMKYEFYDRAGKLLGLDERADEPPIKIGDEFEIEFEGQLESGWKVTAVSEPISDQQMVVIRPI